MIKIQHITFLYFFVIILFFAKDVLYPGGSIISMIVIFLTYLISFTYLLKSLLDKNIYKNNYYWLWLSFLTLNSLMILLAYLELYGVYAGNEEHWVIRSIGITLVSLSFFPIYYFSKRKVDLQPYFKWFTLFLIPILALRFYITRADLISTRDSENVVNNYVYLLTYIVPYIFFLRKKKVLSLIVLVILYTLIIEGAKRGALISATLAGLPYLLYLVISSNNKSKSKYLYYSLYSVLAIFVIVILYKILTLNDYLIQRLNEPGGSERDIIYERIFTNWLDSESLLKMFFGFGFNSTLVLGAGSFAHNDWLEVLVNYGILGLLIYFTLFCSFFKKVFTKNMSLEIRLMTISVFSIWLITSLVSMNYMLSFSIFQSMLIAYIISNGYLNNKT